MYLDPMSLSHRIEPHLMSGEKLVWTGQPDPKKHFSPADRFLIPFSLLWGGFAIAWEVAAVAGTSSGDKAFALFGLPFVAVGLYLIFGRFIYKARRKRKTVYAVTDRRVLSLAEGRSQGQVDAYFISSLPAVNTRVGRDGTGTIIFGNPGSPFWGMANTGWDFFGSLSGGQPFAFFDIPDASHVSDLITKQREKL
jgi:hypothetical protein